MKVVGKEDKRRRGNRPRTMRRAAAVVEFAVVSPMLLAMVFGVMEFGWAFMVHETMTNATREACRVGVLQGTTDDEIRARFVEAMAPTGLTITDDMLTIEHATADDPVVSVSTSVPYSDVTLTGLASFLRIGRDTITASCSMRKEGTVEEETPSE